MGKLPEGILKIELEQKMLRVTIPDKPMNITTFLALLRYVEKMNFKVLELYFKTGEYCLTILKDY